MVLGKNRIHTHTRNTRTHAHTSSIIMQTPVVVAGLANRQAAIIAGGIALGEIFRFTFRELDRRGHIIRNAPRAWDKTVAAGGGFLGVVNVDPAKELCSKVLAQASSFASTHPYLVAGIAACIAVYGAYKLYKWWTHTDNAEPSEPPPPPPTRQEQRVVTPPSHSEQQQEPVMASEEEPSAPPYEATPVVEPAPPQPPPEQQENVAWFRRLCRNDKAAYIMDYFSPNRLSRDAFHHLMAFFVDEQIQYGNYDVAFLEESTPMDELLNIFALHAKPNAGPN